MALHRPDNPYQGINAHLNSYLQQHSVWGTFHNAHVVHLCEAIAAALPVESGYYAVTESSLQILKEDLLSGERGRITTFPDIGIYRTGGNATAPEALEEPATLALIDTFLEPERTASVMIYRLQDGQTPGKPVTRIELLSPANKPPGSHFGQYITNREATLQTGINMVEIDYLHERRSPIAIIPDYTLQEKGSYPYLLLVSNPHPDVLQGRAQIAGFRVDDPIPQVRIPLAADESIVIDLNAVYQRTFQSNPAYGMVMVDYEQKPEGFETYGIEDRQRILALMTKVAS